MSRSVFPFAVGDISVLARSLHAQLAQADDKPGHVTWLNMLARAAGFRNYQHFRASQEAEERLQAPPPPTPAAIDHAKLERLARYFDAQGLLTRWPSKASHRVPCLWMVWSRLTPRQSFSEKAINAQIEALHQFGDYALLRRELVDGGWLTRKPDGSDYRRVERQPPPEALALIRHLGARLAA
ncbi:DUF2087 domain-containing protein [Rhodopseudomonas palustris]|uniref:DUF2087 domain-containing protein n=1 Tax=Rhodopseudomonas palustris (strain BisB18) TaxID=316056 RepID=Q211B2_RHOPB